MFQVRWLVVVSAMTLVAGDDEAKKTCTYQPDAPNPPSQPVAALQYSLRTETVQQQVNADADIISLVEYGEWVYDAPGNRIAVWTSSKRSRTAQLMDWNTHQLLILSASKEVGKFDDCVVRPVTEAMPMFPVLYGAGLDLSPDQIPDPGVPLGILNWTNTQYKGNLYRREISSYRWEWCGLDEFEEEMGTDMISMATYWSDPSWKMPVPSDTKLSVPLGWEVLKWGEDINDFFTPTRANIMKYQPGEASEAAFTIPLDLYCHGMEPAPNHPFPDYSQEHHFSFSLEYRETEAKTVLWADAWYDFSNKLYRIDHDVTSPQDSSAFATTTTTTTTTDTITTTLLIDYNDGVAFEFVPGMVTECRVSLVDNVQGDDWADLTGFDHLRGDSPDAFFGTDLTNYTYYGPGEVRYMANDDWRGLRSDWPPNAVDDTSPTMLWQWSFTNKNVSALSAFGDQLLVEKQVPVGLIVTAQENINTTEGVIPRGFSIMYSIYDFEISLTGKTVEFNGLRVFDAYDCFSANWRDHLRFKLDVSSWPEVLEKPLITSSFLTEYWQVILANKGQVSPLRITRVQTVVEEAGEVWVDFTLLDRHWRIGDLNSTIFRNMTSGDKAKQFIAEAMNKGDIKYVGQRPNGEKFELLAVPGSLSTVVEPDCTTTTTTTTPTTTTSTTTTTPANGNGNGDGGKTLYTPGDLAGLGIGMLLMGFAFGAGGTFLVVVKGVHRTVLGCCTKG